MVWRLARGSGRSTAEGKDEEFGTAEYAELASRARNEFVSPFVTFTSRIVVADSLFEQEVTEAAKFSTTDDSDGHGFGNSEDAG